MMTDLTRFILGVVIGQRPTKRTLLIIKDEQNVVSALWQYEQWWIYTTPLDDPVRLALAILSHAWQADLDLLPLDGKLILHETAKHVRECRLRECRVMNDD